MAYATISGAYGPSEGHRKWSQGLLYDNHLELDGPRFIPRLLGLCNRGYYGTGHGWATVHSVAWACDVADGDLIVQQPPTGQNYAIGCAGNVSGECPPALFPCPGGYIEGANQPNLQPRSLYLAQLEDRLGQALVIDQSLAAIVPANYTLSQYYPNPFNPSTTIEFSLPKSEHTTLKVFNILGKEVTTLISNKLNQGNHTYTFDGRNLASGIYYYQLLAGDYREVKKMILLR